ncbi:MAG: hypothetical protein ACPGD5_10795 [Salibacteraceae bacterium]
MKKYLSVLVVGFAMISCDSVTDKVSEAAVEAVAESLSGDSVKIDFHGEDGEVNLEVTNDDGSTTSWDLNTENHELPEDFPTDVYLIPNAKRGMVSVVDSPDGKYVVIQDTLFVTMKEAGEDLKSNNSNFKLDAEIKSGPMHTLSFSSNEISTFSVSLLDGEEEGYVTAQYGIMY